MNKNGRIRDDGFWLSEESEAGLWRTVLAVSQVLRWGDGAGRSGLALNGAGRSEVKPPCLDQPGALQELAPLQGHAVVWRPEVRRSGGGRPRPAGYSVCDPKVAQSQTLVAWRGGRGSSVTLVLSGGRDTVHWMDVKVEIKGGWRKRRMWCTENKRGKKWKN